MPGLLDILLASQGPQQPMAMRGAAAPPAQNGAAVMAGMAPQQAPQQGGLLGSMGGDQLAPQPQQQASQQGGGLLGGIGDFMSSDRGRALSDMFAGWAMGRTPGESLGLGAQAMSLGSEKRQAKQQALAERNVTVKWLRQQGLDETTAAHVATSKDALNAYHAQWAKGLSPEWKTETFWNQNGRKQSAVFDPRSGSYKFVGGEERTDDKPTDLMREFQFAKSQGYDGDFMEYQLERKRREEGGNAYGTPIYGTDESGNAAVGQLTKDGKLIVPQTPSGFRVAPNTGQIDTGTGTLVYDKRTGADVRNVRKDVAGEASEKAIGAVQGAAAAEIGSEQVNSAQITRQINDLKNDPDFASVIGSVQGRIPAWAQGESQRRVQSKINQLKGGAFLQAFNLLKGGGDITEAEGAKAEQAMARMDQAQSEGDFKQALDDFSGAVSSGLDKLKARAGRGGSPGGQTTGGVTWSVK